MHDREASNDHLLHLLMLLSRGLCRFMPVPEFTVTHPNETATVITTSALRLTYIHNVTARDERVERKEKNLHAKWLVEQRQAPALSRSTEPLAHRSVRSFTLSMQVNRTVYCALTLLAGVCPYFLCVYGLCVSPSSNDSLTHSSFRIVCFTAHRVRAQTQRAHQATVTIV